VTKTLTEIFDKLNMPEDLAVLSVDTEGMDFEVFRGLDFEKYKPRVIVSEDISFNSHLEGQKERIRWRRGSIDSDEKNRRKETILMNNGYIVTGRNGIDNMYLLRTK
jgi:hypothetical protein